MAWDDILSSITVKTVFFHGEKGKKICGCRFRNCLFKWIRHTSKYYIHGVK